MSDASVAMAVLRLVVSLAVVLTLLVGLARYAARRGAGGLRGGKSTVRVEVLSRRALSKGSSLQVVQVGGQVMVLGVTDRSVAVLRELGEDDVEVAAPERPERPERPGLGAATVPDLGTRAGRKAAAATPTGWPWSAAAFVVGRVGARRG